MNEFTAIAALTLVYFLLVYLFAVRKAGQRIEKWLVCILLQAVSVYFFPKLADLLKSVPVIGGMSESLLQIIALLLLILLNLPVVILLSDKQERAEEQETEQNTSPAPVTPSFHQEPSFDLTKMENNAFAFDIDRTPPKEIMELDEKTKKENDELYRKIEEMIQAGRKEDALKYLKMMAFYENDPEKIQRATELMEQIQQESAGDKDNV